MLFLQACLLQPGKQAAHWLLLLGLLHCLQQPRQLTVLVPMLLLLHQLAVLLLLVLHCLQQLHQLAVLVPMLLLLLRQLAVLPLLVLHRLQQLRQLAVLLLLLTEQCILLGATGYGLQQAVLQAR
jgi:hypothetical protein